MSTRNQRFAMMSTARPFSPTMALPTDAIGRRARQQLIYLYPLRFFPPAVPPVTAVVSDTLVYGVDISDDTAFSVTLSDA